MNDKKPENPLAFPHSPYTHPHGDVMTYGEYGMTLRDYFAAAALQGLLSGEIRPAEINEEGYRIPSLNRELFSDSAFSYADAMLRAREK